MRWQMGRRSENVEDLRGAGGRMRGGMKMGCGTVLLVIIISFLFGQNPLQLLSILSDGGGSMSLPQNYQPTAEENQAAEFVSVILGDMEDTWPSLLRPMGVPYVPPKLVLFSDMVESACGYGSATSGPFYCPPDQKIYIDLSFFNELHRLGAPGDFAQAYVIAHEVGHHVQNLLGVSDKVRRLQSQVGEAEANALSVMLELQADCYAGVWAYHANQQRQVLEPGDVEEGLRAAASIGDDRLLRMSGRAVQPESFTHGSSEQRAQWLRIGLTTGDCDECDTFARMTQ
ncbi:neutral zinc metallopeptidase [candidate division KSB1 bacterium]|nr:neutral zinc metallopeptidase [candidate division KSB1 bacterium]